MLDINSDIAGKVIPAGDVLAEMRQILDGKQGR